MKQLNQFIQEKLHVDKDTKIDTIVYSLNTNKKLDIKLVADDKESWKKFESFIKQLNRFNLIKYSRILVCHLENGNWITNTKQTYSINEYQPNYMYLYSSKKNFYTYKKVIEMLESGEYIIILANK